jgi:hypothetical protein
MTRLIHLNSEFFEQLALPDRFPKKGNKFLLCKVALQQISNYYILW